MKIIDPHKTVAEITASTPGAFRVFMKHDIDFCCGGNIPVEEAAQNAELSVETLVHELEAAKESSVPGEHVDWSESTSMELISHIIERYHRSLREMFPPLDKISAKIASVHGEGPKHHLVQLRETLSLLMGDMLDHLETEERELFPVILSGENSEERRLPVVQLEEEHREVAKSLERIRKLTNRFTPPEDSCNTFRAYYAELERLDHETRRHIHLENNVLFPRVAELIRA
jgi:regulator of cell morphogenesis and NO signaling